MRLLVAVRIACMVDEEAHGGRWSIGPARGRGRQKAMNAADESTSGGYGPEVGWPGVSETE
jgi:hypothetical protein